MKKLIALIVMMLLSTATICLAEEKTTPNSTEENVVIFNPKSKIYHHVSCKMAKRCTKNCIKTSKEQALQQGGKECHFCGEYKLKQKKS